MDVPEGLVMIKKTRSPTSLESSRRFGAPSPCSGSYDLDSGTAAQVVGETTRAAWKADPTTAVEIVLDGGSKRRTLGWVRREPQRLVIATWFIDFPPTRDPMEVMVTARVKHKTRGCPRIGTKFLRCRVVEPPAP